MGSTRCEVIVGEHGTPAVRCLVGDMHDRIEMFDVIEQARMTVGTQANATVTRLPPSQKATPPPTTTRP